MIDKEQIDNWDVGYEMENEDIQESYHNFIKRKYREQDAREEETQTEEL